MNRKTNPEFLLGSTAYWTAGVRARESEREAGLFHDPWAALLAGEKGKAWMASRSDDSVLPIAIRTRFFDDFLTRITRDFGIQQVILLAAGLDTRGYRLPWPAGTSLFELDQPAIMEYKEKVLLTAGAQPACTRQVIAVDLTAPWTDEIISHGFDLHRPSLWLLEGFLFYLENAVITWLLDTITGLVVPESWLGFDIVNSVMLVSPVTRKWLEMQAQSGAPWIGTMDDPVGFLAQRGWEAALTQAGAEDANYGRWPYPVFPTEQPDIPHNWFVTARYQPGH